MAKYKDLLSVLKKNGCQYIELPLDDMIPFIKYLTKANYKDKVFIAVNKGKVKFSNQPNKQTTPKQLAV